MAITQVGIIIQHNGDWGDHNWFNTSEAAIDYLNSIKYDFDEDEEDDEE